MRNAWLIPLALVLAIASATSCAAQTVAPTSTTAPTRSTASAPPSESVGALSPNEQKRAERARARAAAALKVPAPMSVAATAPAHDRPEARQSAPPHRHVVVRYSDTGASRRDQRANEPQRIAISTRPAKRLAEARYIDRARAPRVGDVIPPGVALSVTPPEDAVRYRQTAMAYPRGPWFYPPYRPFYRPIVRPASPFFGPYYE